VLLAASLKRSAPLLFLTAATQINRLRLFLTAPLTKFVGTVSGTSISFGTPVVFDGEVNYLSVVFDNSNSKVVVTYMDGDNSNFGTAIVGTVSGTSISFSTPVVFESTTTSFISSCYDTSNSKVVVFYRHSGNSNIGSAKVGTVSGTSISFGTLSTFTSSVIGSSSAVFDTSLNKVVVCFRDVTNSSHGFVVVGEVSGADISFETPAVFDETPTAALFSVFDLSANKTVVSYEVESGTVFGRTTVLQPKTTNLTAENFAGFTGSAYSDTQTATIQSQGAINDKQSGLTPGQVYYVQTDGTLSTTPGDPSVVAGTAVAANKIIVEG